MNPILPTEEFEEVEGRVYSNPQTGIAETSDFIDKFRQTQQANTDQISAETQALGTNVPSNLGGLTGGTGYWTSRFQTPTTNALVQDLRTTAQATALNEVLANEQAKWKKRYQDAYRAYQKRQYDASKTSQNPYASVPGDEPDTQTTTPEGTSETSVSGYPGTYTVTDIAGNLHVVDMNTGDEEVIAPGQSSKTWQSASSAVGGGTLRTLPNGNKVLVKPGYGLTKENGKYYLVNQSTGARTEVGGY